MEKLQDRISRQMYTKLIDAGFDSLKLILLTDENVLKHNMRLDSKELENLLETVSDIILINKIDAASEAPECRRICTGCNLIDSTLRGGIPVNGITEIYGRSGVGKTQFCLQLSLTVQLPENLGGLGKGAVYTCTEDRFPSKRLNQLIKMRRSQFSNILADLEDNIYVEHIADFEQLRRFVFVRLPVLLSKANIGLVVIDSIAGAFRNDNYKINYVARKEDFISVCCKLQDMCKHFGIALICTNQVACNLQSGNTEPALGLAWSNIVTHRIKISRNFDSSLRSIFVEFSPNMPPSTCKFLIKDFGLTEVAQEGVFL